jgi:hypothetical protein
VDSVKVVLTVMTILVVACFSKACPAPDISS